MRHAHPRGLLIVLLGCLGLLSSRVDLLRAGPALADQLVSAERLQAMEAVHKQNMGRLHGLHHEMRATVKRLSKDRSDAEAAAQLAIQLRAVSQALETVAATEKDHPQWALSWSQRQARLVVLTQDMEVLLLMGPRGRDSGRSLDQLGKKLQEMKEILDIW